MVNWCNYVPKVLGNFEGCLLTFIVGIGITIAVIFMIFILIKMRKNK